jgi:heme/copper-type cytochrome/quinol oxidase subunit 2
MLKPTLAVLAVVVIAGVGWYVYTQRSYQPKGTDSVSGKYTETMPMPASDSQDAPRSSDQSSNGSLVDGVREFSMDSYYDMPAKKAVFTLGEMVVKKGEKVRVKVRNTFGKHDFTIDELDVHVVTPQGQTTPVEFTADRAGQFIYYCSMPNHRSLGQWGILKVVENQ